MRLLSAAKNNDISQGVTVARDAILSVSTALPVVGTIAELLLQVADKYGELSGTLDDASQVKGWAFTQARSFTDLKNRTSDGDTEIDAVLRGQLKEVARSLDQLLTTAAKINKGSKAAKLLKAGIFQKQFQAAKDDVERARVDLDRTLAIDTNTTVHAVKDDTQKILKKLDALSAKIEAIEPKTEEEVDAKERKQSLVAVIQSQPAESRAILADIAEKVVDGDNAAAAAALAAAPPAVRGSGIYLFAEGLTLLQEHRWSEAIIALKKCVTVDSGMAEAWFQLGMAYNYQNLREGGHGTEASYEPWMRCIALNPRHTEAYVRLGILFSVGARKDHDGAEKIFRKAIELDPSFAKAYIALGMLLAAVRQDHVSAEKMFREAIKVDPSDESAYFNLGKLLCLRNKYDDAEQMFRKAIELAPFRAFAYRELGILLDRVRHDSEGAQEMFRQAIKIDPKDFTTLSKLGGLLMERGDYAGAEQVYRKAIELDPSNALAYINLGNVLSEEDVNEAYHMYRKAIELDPSNALAYINLGKMFHQRKDYNDAEQMYRKAIELDSSNAVLYSVLGIVLSRRKDLNGAEQMYRKAIELDPSDACAYGCLGSILYEREDYNGAEQMYRKAIELDPSDADARQRLADISSSKNRGCACSIQ